MKFQKYRNRYNREKVLKEKNNSIVFCFRFVVFQDVYVFCFKRLFSYRLNNMLITQYNNNRVLTTFPILKKGIRTYTLTVMNV